MPWNQLAFVSNVDMQCIAKGLYTHIHKYIHTYIGMWFLSIELGDKYRKEQPVQL